MKPLKLFDRGSIQVQWLFIIVNQVLEKCSKINFSLSFPGNIFDQVFYQGIHVCLIVLRMNRQDHYDH